MKFLIYLALIITVLSWVSPTSANSNCLTAGFWVEDGLYNYFQSKGVTFEEWSDRQMEAWNKVLSSSGVKDCFQIGKIVRVRDGALPLNGGLPTNDPDMSDRTIDVQWGFTAEPLTREKDRKWWDDRINGVDWGLIHELSHARYLVDEYGVNVEAGRDKIEVKTPDGVPAVGSYIKPINGSNLLYENKSKDMMASNAQFYAPHTATALNLIAGQRNASLYGNYNAPRNLGIYQNDLPQENVLRILSADSQPLVGAKIRIFQSTGGSGAIYSKSIDNTADISSETDEEGKVSVGKNPFGGGSIDPFMSNVVFLLEVSYENQLFYKFIEVSDFNLAYWQGATNQAIYDVQTNIKPGDIQLAIGDLSPNPVGVGEVLEIKGVGFKNVSESRIHIYKVDSNGEEEQLRNFEIIKRNDKSIKILINEANQLFGSQTHWKVRVGAPDFNKTAEAPKGLTITGKSSTRFYELFADFKSDLAIFDFGYLDSNGDDYKIDISTTKDLSSDVFGGFAQGKILPFTVSDPSAKWAKYACGETLYWRVRHETTKALSPIQSTTINCSDSSALISMLISNYADFREENDPEDAGTSTYVIKNAIYEANLPWTLSTISPEKIIYIRENYKDGTSKDSEMKIADGQAAKVGNVRIMAKVIKQPAKIVKIMFGDKEFKREELSTSFKYILTNNAGVSQDIPVSVELSDGTFLNFTYRFIFPAQSSVAPSATPSDALEPSPTAWSSAEPTSSPVPINRTVKGWYCVGNQMYRSYQDGVAEFDCTCGDGSPDCGSGTTCINREDVPAGYEFDAKCITPLYSPAPEQSEVPASNPELESTVPQSEGAAGDPCIYSNEDGNCYDGTIKAQSSCGGKTPSGICINPSGGCQYGGHQVDCSSGDQI